MADLNRSLEKGAMLYLPHLFNYKTIRFTRPTFIALLGKEIYILIEEGK